MTAKKSTRKAKPARKKSALGGKGPAAGAAWFDDDPKQASPAFKRAAVKVAEEAGTFARAADELAVATGDGELVLGDYIFISGKIGIAFSRQVTQPPRISIGDHSFIGHGCSFSAAREICIGQHCLIAGNVRIMDNDGHPLDAVRRQNGEPVNSDEIDPVSIGDGVWIGQRSMILKGVTIGQNAVIGAGSVVTTDIPANTLAAGVPAKVIRALEGQG